MSLPSIVMLTSQPVKVCPNCTHLNPDTVLTCEVCDTPLNQVAVTSQGAVMQSKVMATMYTRSQPGSAMQPLAKLAGNTVQGVIPTQIVLLDQRNFTEVASTTVTFPNYAFSYVMGRLDLSNSGAPVFPKLNVVQLYGEDAVSTKVDEGGTFRTYSFISRKGALWGSDGQGLYVKAMQGTQNFVVVTKAANSEVKLLQADQQEFLEVGDEVSIGVGNNYITLRVK